LSTSFIEEDDVLKGVPLKALIFDYDETLVESLKAFHYAFNVALSLAGALPLSHEDFFHLYVNDALESVIPPGIPHEKFWEYFLRAYENLKFKPVLRNGAVRVLRQLRDRGIKLALITGRKCSLKTFVRELEEIGIRRFFDFTATCLVYEDRSFAFSKKLAIREAMTALNVGRREVALIGDYKTDMRSAKDLGILAIGICTAHAGPKVLSAWGADIVIEKLDDLIPCLERRELL